MQLAQRTIESDDPGVEVALVNDVPAALFRWCNILLYLNDAANLPSVFSLLCKSMLGAGYRCLGDLRWVPSRELMILHYVSFK